MYDLEIEKTITKIINSGYKKVLIQLPEGLKVKSDYISDKLEENGIIPLIWFSSCFGACDLPKGLDCLNIDAIISFGHSEFEKKEW